MQSEHPERLTLPCPIVRVCTRTDTRARTLTPVSVRSFKPTLSRVLGVSRPVGGIIYLGNCLANCVVKSLSEASSPDSDPGGDWSRRPPSRARGPAA